MLKNVEIEKKHCLIEMNYLIDKQKKNFNSNNDRLKNWNKKKNILNDEGVENENVKWAQLIQY